MSVSQFSAGPVDRFLRGTMAYRPVSESNDWLSAPLASDSTLEEIALLRHTPIVLLATLICPVLCGGAADAQDWMLRLSHEGREVVGQPLHWDSESFVLLSRDGQMYELDMGAAQQGTTIKQGFSSFGAGQMRSQLAREFGSAFEVQGTGHYLVVHPAGQREWPRRFEQLYREMIHYFGARGISIKRPQFPLVAIVFPTRQSFFRYSASQGGPTSSSLLGYYSPESNRIMLFDVTGGRTGEDWRLNAETIVHEAAHQTAFNVGIHSRLTMPPRWLAEGLGTLFEAPGIYSSATFPRKEDRLNHEQLANYRQYFKDGIPDGLLAAMVASDEAFRRATFPAYSLSWAFTFMAAETQPSKLSRYLKLTANKKPFSKPAAAERLRDFQSVFGKDMKMTEARLERFMAEL